VPMRTGSTAGSRWVKQMGKADTAAATIWRATVVVSGMLVACPASASLHKLQQLRLHLFGRVDGVLY
jgi:hypothetical protein